MAVSLSTSDLPCAINHTLANLFTHLAHTTFVVLHIGCGSNTTAAERRLFGSRPRVRLNPECVRVHGGDGSILHAHLLNANLLASAPPRTLLLASADMRWLASGVEAAAARAVSSVLSAPWIQLDEVVAAIRKNARSSFDDADLELSVGVGRRLVVQKHEGSFYPWTLVRDFSAALSRRGGLERLERRSAVFARPVLSLVPEETLLPSFAAARLNASGRRVGSILELDQAISGPGNGVLCGFEMKLRRREWRCRGDAAQSCLGTAVFARKAEGPGAHVEGCTGVAPVLQQHGMLRR